jgi:hypothetical protein
MLAVSDEGLVDCEPRRTAFQEKWEPGVPVDLVILDRTELLTKFVTDFGDDGASPVLPLVHVDPVHICPCC